MWNGVVVLVTSKFPQPAQVLQASRFLKEEEKQRGSSKYNKINNKKQMLMWATEAACSKLRVQSEKNGNNRSN